mmetsp:Transcript_49719/g.122084  ORF Transcript_49719/g.122084 Transcript_49719/m.122084 type:complete len:226 (-) Transcript_49719:56-733(-)
MITTTIHQGGNGDLMHTHQRMQPLRRVVVDGYCAAHGAHKHTPLSKVVHSGRNVRSLVVPSDTFEVLRQVQHDLMTVAGGEQRVAARLVVHCHHLLSHHTGQPFAEVDVWQLLGAHEAHAEVKHTNTAVPRGQVEKRAAAVPRHVERLEAELLLQHALVLAVAVLGPDAERLVGARRHEHAAVRRRRRLLAVRQNDGVDARAAVHRFESLQHLRVLVGLRRRPAE